MRSKQTLISPSPFFDLLILKSWWVILFFMICFFIFDQASHHQKKQKEPLQNKLTQIKIQTEKALLKQKDLQLQIASQSDPEYIEMILMRKLDLIHEGQIKVLFTD